MADIEWWQRAGRSVKPSVAFGQNVRRLRLLKNLDQASLARKLHECGAIPNARQNTVSRIENASRPVSVDEVVALAWLLEGKAKGDGSLMSLFADPATSSKRRRSLVGVMVLAARDEAAKVRERLDAANSDMQKAEAELQRLLDLQADEESGGI